MSNHEATIAHIDNEIEKLEGERKKAEGDVIMAKAALERREKEVNLIDFQLKEYQNTRACLVFDRAAAAADADPRGLRVLKDQPQA